MYDEDYWIGFYALYVLIMNIRHEINKRIMARRQIVLAYLPTHLL